MGPSWALGTCFERDARLTTTQPVEADDARDVPANPSKQR